MIGVYSGINPVKRLGRNLLTSGFYGHSELRAIQQFTFSFESDLTSVLSTELTMQKIGLMYLHSWLLDHHLKRRSYSAEGHFLAKEKPWKILNKLRSHELNLLLDLMIKTEHVFLFSNEFSREIHDELKRARRTLWATLNMHQLGRFDLPDALYHHVLME